MHPDYFFLLKTSLQTVLKRIEERNRGSEAAVDVEY
ncbi:MAG: hypothetical protein DRP42_02415 [Tenericutes bacterium]|nr:MAG: hypothetical protein DRP42_02415 [Mycoplasmatota bacterium]